MNNKTTVKIEKLTANRLNVARKGSTQDAYLLAMLDYFEATGINPLTPTLPVSEQFKSGIERVVKMIKAIERDKINLIVDTVKEIKKGGVSLNPGEGGSTGFSEDDMVKVAERITLLEGDLKNAKDERDRYLKKAEQLQLDLDIKHNNSGSLDNPIITELIRSLENLGNSVHGNTPIPLQRSVIFDITDKLKKAIQ